MKKSQRSKGALALAQLGEPQKSIAAKLDVSIAAVAMWATAERTPGLRSRRKIFAVYGIGVNAWDEKPGGTPASAPPVPPAPVVAPSEGNAVMHPVSFGGRAEALERSIDDTMRSLHAGETPLTILERTKVHESLVRLLNSLRRLKGEEVPEFRVVKHPKWIALRDVIIRALTAHPEALADVMQAIHEETTDAAVTAQIASMRQ